MSSIAPRSTLLNMTGPNALRIALIAIALWLLILWPVVAHCEERPFKVAHAALWTLGSIDVTQSLIGLERGAREVNPVYRPFTSSPARFVLTKAALVGGGSAVLWQMRKSHPRRAAVLTGVLLGLQGAVVVSNARQLGKMR